MDQFEGSLALLLPHFTVAVRGFVISLAAIASFVPVLAAAQEGPSALAGDAMDEARIEEAIAAADTPAEDPWEGFNRSMFKVHNIVDKSILVPTSLAYRAVTPKRGRRGIRRFLANLRAPGIFVNDILQGEFGRAGETVGRFIVNSTIGAGGFADPAAELGIEAHREDFGQTLAVWGVDSGPYLFLPLIGPSTVRDTFGTGVQIFMDPLFYPRSRTANVARFTRASIGGISAREPFIEPLREMEENSLDYYASFRSFYLQTRQRQILNGQTDFNALPTIQDDEFDEFDEIE